MENTTSNKKIIVNQTKNLDSDYKAPGKLGVWQT